MEFFEKRVRPILAQRCHKCHSRQAEAVKRGLAARSTRPCPEGRDPGAGGGGWARAGQPAHCRRALPKQRSADAAEPASRSARSQRAGGMGSARIALGAGATRRRPDVAVDGSSALGEPTHRAGNEFELTDAAALAGFTPSNPMTSSVTDWVRLLSGNGVTLGWYPILRAKAGDEDNPLICSGAPSLPGEATDVTYKVYDDKQYDTLALYRTANGMTQGANAIEVDPDFVDPSADNFRLKSGSPCRDAGVSVGLTKDFDGNPITGTPDMGAFEFQPS